MATAFQANAFQNNAFQIDGSVAEVVSGGDLRTTRDDLRHALHFYDNFAPHAKRKAEEIVDRAAAAERLAEASKRSQDAEHVAQMGLLRAEFLAMAETREARDQARQLFAVLVAQESERQDAEAAFMAFMLSQI